MRVMRGGWLARLLPKDNLASTIYGTVLVSSVIVTLGEGSENVGEMITSIAVTAIVFALAHAWAVALEVSAAAHQPPRWPAFEQGLKQEWPIAEAAVPAIIALVLAGIGVYSKSTGLWVAIGLNTALLFAWGAGLRQRAGGTARQLFTTGISSAAFGLALVLLKVLVH